MLKPGVFRFRFWQFGEWVEVVVDDKLPVDVDGNLKFGHNRTQTNEFWGPLLEKAYAKSVEVIHYNIIGSFSQLICRIVYNCVLCCRLYGSYQAIDTGHIRDALVDMTGGLSEAYNLKKQENLPPNLYDIISKSFVQGSLLGSGIWVSYKLLKEFQYPFAAA